jgi:hypothetical protein
MPYTLLPDEVIDDPRTTNAGRHLGPNGIGRAIAVLVESFSYANRNLTDGAVDRFVARYFKTDRRPLDVLTALSFRLPATTHTPRGEPGWMHETDIGWQIADWSRQPVRADVLARRAKDRARKAADRSTSPRLIEIAETVVENLSPETQRQVIHGNRLDLLEHIRGIAAKANIDATGTHVERAVDQVCRRYGGMGRRQS